MKQLPALFKHQLIRYASAPNTYVSVAIFLVLSTASGLYTGQWQEQSSSDLGAFFQFHPWLYLLLAPALALQVRSNEQKPGRRDFMDTLPITVTERVLGTFLAAWSVCAIALSLMFPVIIAANYLGTADNGVIASQLLGSWLLAGSYLSVGFFMGAITHQRVVAFVLTFILLMTTGGLFYILNALEHQAPIWLIDSFIALDPLSRFGAIDHGKLTLRDSLYFISMIIAFLSATTVTLNCKAG
ncbi:ABC transporter permease [Pseudomonas tolaasii]|uniref:ABC transporter permease n=1 Tax=Pseudomonas tolaasii TaxID=29442 RepID=UPI000372CA92|nr:ABC transporter permease [Pseudomonas tolaasii]MBW4796371.1 ABC transporter permease [Pseudomonas tolaasii]NVZ45159.1 ABC transporter permease [Pseudomonas tolaasii]NWA48861.1 ABC transporter permease [Pseudomonas tolaasii]NWC30059.1 ABC transporter permease [Pseudomonas tolaasii]NWC53827.1 ABC transporter permease [Pseudomonas tolaasii]